MVNQNNFLYQLMSDPATEMTRLGYTEKSLKHYWTVWKRYLKFTSIDRVERSDMDTFLKKVYRYAGRGNTTTTRYQRTAIRALNVLEYFEEFRKLYIRFPVAKPINIETPFDSILSEFISMLKESSYAKATIHTHERVVNKFLHFLKHEGLTSINGLNEKLISGFMLEITGHRGKVSYESGSLRKFFRYLHKEGLVDKDYSLFIPASNCLRCREHLPTVWQEDDVSRILKCIDTGNPVGKRDYAMILLAIRLGLRGSDIKNLYFSNINWEADTITIMQVKTKESVVFPLLADVGEALLDYLMNSRPISKEPGCPCKVTIVK